jgi:hypothetical protein
LAESERVEKIFRANGPPIQAVVAILISDKIDFRLRSIKGDNEDHFIIIKETIHQEKITIHDIYMLNINTPKYPKKSLLD